MERALSADERIKRAEEIYYKRKMLSGNNEIARVNVNEKKKSFGLLKKTVLQIAICIVIYLIVHLVQTTNYIFSEDVLNKANEILSYDINFESAYNNSLNYIYGLLINKEKEDKEENEENIEQQETVETSTIEETIEGIEPIQEEIIENLTQEEQDIKYVLENISMIKPLTRYYYIKVWT